MIADVYIYCSSIYPFFMLLIIVDSDQSSSHAERCGQCDLVRWNE